MTTDKTIKSKYQPKQTNVTWVDLSGKTPVEKHFINGGWVKIGSGSGSGSECDCGIPTIDKSIQPNIVWRDATEEDLAKFVNSSAIDSVADLPNGQVPTLLIYKDLPFLPSTVHSVISVTLPSDVDDGHVSVGGPEAQSFYVSGDWSLLGKSREVS